MNSLVSLTWVQAHSGVPGNEQADHLAKTASCQPYIGPEPALPMPYNAVKTAIRQWAYVQANNRWQNIKTCQQAKLIIQGHSSGRTWELLRLPRQKLRLATGILTGHSQLNRHLSVMGVISDPTCNYCEEGLETAAHFLCDTTSGDMGKILFTPF